MPSGGINKKRARIRKAACHGTQPTTPTAEPRIRRPLLVTKADLNAIGFSDMPAEIRNLIYGYALAPSNGEAVRLAGGPHVRDDIAFNLLRSCRAVRKEATGLFYGNNIFRIDMLNLTREKVPTELSKTWPAFQFDLLCPEYNEWKEKRSMPNLVESLSAIGSKGLRSMKSLIFAYHGTPPLPIDDNNAKDLPEHADLLTELNLLRKAPYYKLSLIGGRCVTTQDEASVRQYTSRISSFIASDMSARAITAFSKRDIITFAKWIADSGARSTFNFA